MVSAKQKTSSQKGEIISQVYYDNDSDEIAKSDYIFDENDDDFYVNIIGYYQKKEIEDIDNFIDVLKSIRNKLDNIKSDLKEQMNELDNTMNKDLKKYEDYLIEKDYIYDKFKKQLRKK